MDKKEGGNPVIFWESEAPNDSIAEAPQNVLG
jgi:hypothetical protein